MDRFILFATPRSGTNIIEKHYRQRLPRHGYQWRNEILNTEIRDVENVELERQKRFEEVKQDSSIAFKVFPHHLNNESFSFLRDNSFFVCLYREDVLQQILSWYIAEQSGNWLTKKKIEENSLILPRSEFERKYKAIMDWSILYKSIPKNRIRAVYSYEQICFFLEQDHLPYIGFDDIQITMNAMYNPINIKNKLINFKNAGEISKWWNNRGNIKPNIVDINNFKAWYPGDNPTGYKKK